MTADEIKYVEMSNNREVNMTDWSERVKSFLLYGDPSQKALVAEGEAGCGKSEITVQVCKELGLEPIVIPGVGAQQQEELLSAVALVADKEGDGYHMAQGVIESLVPTQRIVDSGDYTITRPDGTKRTVVPYIWDEIFTGNVSQMNQLRAVLSFRRIAGTTLPVEVAVIGTTNPEDIAYSSRRSVDAAVMDRIALYRVKLEHAEHMKYLQKLEMEDKYPTICRTFLNMDNNKELWPIASPRFWHCQFGNTWKELTSHSGDRSWAMRMLRVELDAYFEQVATIRKLRGEPELPFTAAAILARFNSFLEYGDDPTKYPISFSSILKAGAAKKAAERKDHIKLFKHWKSKDEKQFIAITVYDMISGLCILIEGGDTDKLTDSVLNHIISLLDLSEVAIVTELFNTISTKNGDLYETMIDKLKATSIWESVHKSALQYTRVVSNLKKKKLLTGRKVN